MSASDALYTGRVMHQRMRPARHRLAYSVFSVLLDLDDMAATATRLRVFSLDRFNLFSLHGRDYGDGSQGANGLRLHVERQLQEAGVVADGAIRLLSMPRILGYAFNPLSVYFCHAADGALVAILYEVNNTFGQRHSYLIEVDEAARRGGLVTQQCDKAFYVSPFLSLDMRYAFRVRPPVEEENSGLSIGITVQDTQGPLLVAQMDAERRTLTDGALIGAFFSHPLLTLKVIAGIHWEALRLIFKGVRLQTRPPAPAHAVTIIKTEDS